MYTYGQTPDDYTKIAQQALPIVQQLLLPTDAVERAGVIEARIANYEGMKRKFPIMAAFYDNEIRKLKAKLAAAQRSTGLQLETERSRRVYRYLGWTAGAVGVLVGVAFIAKLLRRK